MPNHSIGNEVFEFWDGDPPHLVEQTVESFARPGVAGVGQQLTGIRGRPFEAIVTAHFSSYVAALSRLGDYRAMVGTGLFVVVYHNVNFFTGWQHMYTVDDFTPLRCQAATLIGPTGVGTSYYYPSGGVVTGRFLLTPHKV